MTLNGVSIGVIDLVKERANLQFISTRYLLWLRTGVLTNLENVTIFTRQTGDHGRPFNYRPCVQLLMVMEEAGALCRVSCEPNGKEQSPINVIVGPSPLFSSPCPYAEWFWAPSKLAICWLLLMTQFCGGVHCIAGSLFNHTFSGVHHFHPLIGLVFFSFFCLLTRTAPKNL